MLLCRYKIIARFNFDMFRVLNIHSIDFRGFPWFDFYTKANISAALLR